MGDLVPQRTTVWGAGARRGAGSQQPGPAVLPGGQPLQQLIEDGELPVAAGWRTRSSWPTGSGCPGRPCAAPSSTWSSGACWCASAASAPRSCTPRCAGRLELTSLYDDLVKSGQRPRTEIKLLEIRTAPDAVAEALGHPVRSEINWLERLRYGRR